MTNKRRVFRINDNEKIIFQKIEPQVGVSICEDICPYCDICTELKNPIDPENTLSSFCEYCGSLYRIYGSKVNEDSDDFENLIPKEGELEKLFPETDIIQELIKKNKLVPINSIIERVCKGFCDQYTENRINCKSTNKMCLLCDLLIKHNIELDENE